VLLSFAVSSAAASDDWPQFRGPGGEGHSSATGLPLRWSETENSETENLAWKVPTAGRGFSSPVVLGDQIWMTTAFEQAASAEEAKKRLEGNRIADRLEVDRSVRLEAHCFHCDTGKLLAKVRLFHVEQPDPIQAYNSYASPTPVIEPGRLYCDFGTNGTACLDTVSGEILWKRRLPLDHQVGPGSSPIVCGDLLVLVRDGCDQQYVAALDKHTGNTVWKTNRPPIDATYLPYRKAFSTPLVIRAAGRRQMIVPGAQWVVSYDPADGSPIWWADYGSGFSNAARPVFGHGMVYICTGFASQQLWAIRVDGRGDVTETHVVWKAKRQIPKRSSPLLVGEELYLISDSGVATCFDAQTGETHWCERISGDYSASPVYADGRVYFFSEEGKATVLRPGRQFAKLAENHLDGRIMASPAVVGRALLLRSDTHLYRIEKN
jgi:outer membrane protein assembly factor BamB